MTLPKQRKENQKSIVAGRERELESENRRIGDQDSRRKKKNQEPSDKRESRARDGERRERDISQGKSSDS